MKQWIQSAARTGVLGALVAFQAAATEFAGGPPVSQGARQGFGTTTGEVVASWIVDRADNICGLDDPKMLSKPAKIDYDVVLKATAEMKKIKDDKIDPNSPQGIQLRQAAVTRVQKAAEKVRASDGYCSVWKAIRHQDGRVVPDVTDAVKVQL